MFCEAPLLLLITSSTYFGQEIRLTRRQTLAWGYFIVLQRYTCRRSHKFRMTTLAVFGNLAPF